MPYRSRFWDEKRGNVQRCVSRTQRQCSCGLLWDLEAAVSVLVSPCTRLHLCTGMSSDPVAGTFDIEHLRLKPRQQVHASAAKLLLSTCDSSTATKCSLMRTAKLTPLLPCIWELPLPKILMIATQAWRSASGFALDAAFTYYRHFELQLAFELSQLWKRHRNIITSVCRYMKVKESVAAAVAINSSYSDQLANVEVIPGLLGRMQTHSCCTILKSFCSLWHRALNMQAI